MGVRYVSDEKLVNLTLRLSNLYFFPSLPLTSSKSIPVSIVIDDTFHLVGFANFIEDIANSVTVLIKGNDQAPMYPHRHGCTTAAWSEPN